MKKLFKVLSGALVTSMVVALMALPTAAADTGTNYTKVNAQNITFSKYLLVEADANLPAVTFSYTASSTEVSAIAATATTLPVYPGAGTPTIADVTYATTDAAESTSLLSGYDTYKKTIEVNFAGIQFDEPGVHRYYIVETDSTYGGMYCDVDASSESTLRTEGDRYRTLDVYVEDDETTAAKDLIVTGFVMYDGKVATAPKSAASATQGSAITTTTEISVATANGNEAENAVKTDRFVNFYESFAITFGKEVTGNQGSRDKYFKITLTLNSPVAATFDVDVTTNADATVPSNTATKSAYEGESNPTSITVPAGEDKETVFYLQDGQYITVKGIPAGVTYTLDEDAEGYTKTNGITAELSSLDWDTQNSGNDALADAITDTLKDTANGGKDIHTGFTNDKQGIIPTGILMKVGPIIAVGVIVIAGAAFFMVRSMRRKVLEGNDAEETEE